jgi:hypothetical protein
MKPTSGILNGDENEIGELKYWDILEAVESDYVVELSKGMIKAAWNTSNGLYRGEDVITKNKYLEYNYYIPK